MPRNMSFALTTRQIRERTKTVTRRVNWDDLVPGQRLWAVEKCQGLKAGEKVVRLAMIEVVSNRKEKLLQISPDDCEAEGFPELSPAAFVAMFCKHMKVWPSFVVNRIEFKYVETAE